MVISSFSTAQGPANKNSLSPFNTSSSVLSMEFKIYVLINYITNVLNIKNEKSDKKFSNYFYKDAFFNYLTCFIF